MKIVTVTAVNPFSRDDVTTFVTTSREAALGDLHENYAEGEPDMDEAALISYIEQQGVRVLIEEHDLRIEVLTVHNPDSGASVRMWVNGVEEDPTGEEIVDPGAGHEINDWLRCQVDVILADYSEEFRGSALEAFEVFDDSEYVTGDRDDAAITCGRVQGEWPQSFTVCSWQFRPVKDLHVAAAALRAHREAHPTPVPPPPAGGSELDFERYIQEYGR
jgi:hypothetical protein